MVDYRALYFSLFSATETAIEALIRAQNAAEDVICDSSDSRAFLQHPQQECLKKTPEHCADIHAISPELWENEASVPRFSGKREDLP